MENKDWQFAIEFVSKAFQAGYANEALRLLLTPDECSSISTRVKIVQSLLNSNINQRQLKDQLGTGIATVTRGSNGLKQISPEFRQWLKEALPIDDEDQSSTK